MKTNIYLFAFSLLVLWSCNFSVGTNKDFLTGLSVTNNGFSIEGAYLVGPDNVIRKTNEAELGSEMAVVIEGIENYELKDGKAFPGMSMVVTGKDGKDVINEPDLFADGDGYPPADASILRGTITIGAPMKSGEVYEVKIKVWDKNKMDSEINVEVDLEVK